MAPSILAADEVSVAGICPKCQRTYESRDTTCPEDGRRLLMVRPMDGDRVGQVIDGKLTILSLLGSGGMGAVYRALQHSMEREVAVKLLRRVHSEDEGAVRRFLQEARSASRLNHPNTITLFDFGQTEGGELYIVMELLQGRTLRDTIQAEGCIAADRAVAIMSQVCDALHAAHEAGVIHRDLKPDNIFVVPGAGQRGEFIKVLDFGIAKVQADAGMASVTRTGAVCGTPAYMSPEQALGEEVDRRSDVYAAAIVLYELLAGIPPFVADTPVKLMMSHVQDVPAPPRAGRPGLVVPLQIEEIVLRALAKDRGARPPTAQAFKEALVAGLEDFRLRPITIIPPSVDTRAGVVSESFDLLDLGDTLDRMPANAVKPRVEPSQVVEVPLPAPAITDFAPPVRSKRAPWLIAASAIVIGTALALLPWWNAAQPPASDSKASGSAPIPISRAEPVTRAHPPAAPAARQPQAAPSAVAAAPVEPAPKPAPTAAPEPTPVIVAPATASEPPKPAPAAAEDSVRIESVPTGVSLRLGGEDAGTTPCDVARPIAGQKVALELRLAGYRTEHSSVGHDAPPVVRIAMHRAGRVVRPAPHLVR